MENITKNIIKDIVDSVESFKSFDSDAGDRISLQTNITNMLVDTTISCIDSHEETYMTEMVKLHKMLRELLKEISWSFVHGYYNDTLAIDNLYKIINDHFDISDILSW